ncbi:hypothetical protein LTR84_008715 [Exophiala bonariae]|uniref:Zn(2)-C6 fungal-type domain-containing protein n=1 Tax=Exophiala bonariae TaxID=1690606 RepID=A0AAV9MZW3_9EURO|nr:hypothetical protein LTR84_008715 [Exophiala bonariae]
MPYSKAKLQHTLRIFRKLKDDGPAWLPSNEQRHLRDDYNFRQISSSRAVKHVSLFLEENSSSDDLDEYNPSLTKRKRRLARAIASERLPKKAKRQVQTSTGSSQAESTGPGPDTGCVFSTPSSHGDNKKLQNVSKPNTSRFYLDKLDEEAAKIDNQGGRRLRNDKFILDKDKSAANKKCMACTLSKSRCVRKKNNENCCTRCATEQIECIKVDQAVKQLVQPVAQDSDGEVIRETIELPIPDAQASTSTIPNGPLPSARASDSLLSRRGPTPIQTSSSVFPAPLPTPLPTPFHVSPSFKPHQPPTPSQVIRNHAASLRSPPTSYQAGNFSFGSALGNSRESAILLDCSPSPDVSPASSPLPHENLAGRQMTIVTTWAHPINFNHKPTPTDPCHFCSDFRYGIFGYGELEVGVIKYRDSPSYEELGNGHRSTHDGPTKMCIKCTLSRIYISSCKVHSIIQYARRAKDLEEQYGAQLASADWVPEFPTLKAGVLRTCSLCHAPAYFRCNADQCRDKVGRVLTGLRGKGVGCGLMLCDRCAPQVQKDGILKRASIDDLDGFDPRRKQRADVDFLFPGSLLHEAFREITSTSASRKNVA